VAGSEGVAIEQQAETRAARRGLRDVLRLGLFILAAQALFWSLFYSPWTPGSASYDIDRIEFSGFEIAEVNQPTPAAADAATYRAVELPYTDCCDPAYLALRANFDLPEVPAEGLGLIAFQQADNFIIRANGSIVHQIGEMEAGKQTFHGQRAHLVRIPAGLLKPGANQLSLVTVRHGYPYTDLFPPLMGRYEQVRAATATRFWQTIDLRMLGGWLTFILGLFALILLFRSRDRRFAVWLVMLCWSWTAFAAYGLYFTLPFGGIGRMLAFYAVNIAVAASLLGFIDAWTRHPIRHLQVATIGIWLIFNAASLVSLTMLPMPLGFDLINESWTWATFFLGLAVVARLVWHFARVAEDRHLEAALLSICAVCLALDAIGERFGLLAGGYLMDSAPLLLLSFVVAFLQRNFTLFQSAMDLNNLLEKTVKTREAELAVAHERERDLVGRAARTEERRRLMRDMHDGVGGQLVGLLLAVRRGTTDQTRIAEGLQGVMDEIRLMIDSVDSRVTSLAAMLEIFETRVRPRVEDAGFAFGWRRDVAELPDLPPQQVLHLFRLMQEAVTNALKHSGGDRIDITVSSSPEDALRIAIADNGKGLRGDPGGGHGLANMRTRAETIDARIAFEDAGPGLRIGLRMTAHPELRSAA
jgi:two-component system sensor histidine kinase UhpB